MKVLAPLPVFAARGSFKDQLSTSRSAALNEHIRTDDRSIVVNGKNFTPGHFASRFPKNSVPPRRLAAGCRIAAFPSDAFAAVVPPLLAQKWEWLSVQRSELIEFQIEPCCFVAPAQTHPGNRLHSPRQGASCL